MKNLCKIVSMTVTLIVTVFSLLSCNKDYDDNSSNDTLIGVWRHDFSVGYQLFSVEENGNCSLVEVDYVSGNWSEYGTYSLYDNKLTTIFEEEISVYKIITLTSKKMVILLEGSYVDGIPSLNKGEIEEWTRVE